MPCTRRWSLPYSCWPHYFCCRPDCCWPSWPTEHTVGSCSASCWSWPPGPLLPGNFPATFPPSLYSCMGLLWPKCRVWSTSLGLGLRLCLDSWIQSISYITFSLNNRLAVKGGVSCILAPEIPVMSLRKASGLYFPPDPICIAVHPHWYKAPHWRELKQFVLQFLMVKGQLKLLRLFWLTSVCSLTQKLVQSLSHFEAKKDFFFYFILRLVFHPSSLSEISNCFCHLWVQDESNHISSVSLYQHLILYWEKEEPVELCQFTLASNLHYSPSAKRKGVENLTEQKGEWSN